MLSLRDSFKIRKISLASIKAKIEQGMSRIIIVLLRFLLYHTPLLVLKDNYFLEIGNISMLVFIFLHVLKEVFVNRGSIQSTYLRRKPITFN